MLRWSVVVLWSVAVASAAVAGGKRSNAIEGEADWGEPVFLTPYIESGDIEKAREKSRTGSFPGAPELLSYSGFFTVSKRFNNNLFFWFVPALNKDKNAPILLWFQGGPGLSGLFGFFVEHGPFVLHANMTASMRDFNWAQNFQVIYVDNPVGSGFSFTRTEPGGYVINQEDVAEDMFHFMQQFFKVFYEYKKNDFYVTGESYGGKYATSLAYRIHTEGASSGINLKGVAIGNGWLDPESMLDYGSFLYQIGMVDEMQAAEMKEHSDRIVDDIRQKKWMEALEGYSQLIAHYRTLPTTTSLYANFTGMDFVYNLLWNGLTKDFGYWQRYIELPGFRKAANIGNLTLQDGRKAQKALLPDIMQSVKPQIAVLMDNYKVLIFNGQLDVIQPYTSTVNFVRSVDWKLKNEYRTAERKKWTIFVRGQPKYVGYYHQVKDFIEVMVRDAGHILPYDQPMLAFNLITRFVNNIPLSGGS